MEKLPVHGFVLAGGKSSRMGADKATLAFRGRPMVAIAVATLDKVCERVNLAGNREDLAVFAPIVREKQDGVGPTAGIAAGMGALEGEWALFMPVDTPLMPAGFLRNWAAAVLARPGTRASYVRCGEHIHPALCLIHRSCGAEIAEAVQAGQRRVVRLLEMLDGLWVAEAEEFAAREDARRWLTNLNTPEDLAAASNA